MMKKIKTILFPLLAILLVALFVGSQFFIKVKIECQSQFGTCPTEVSDKLNLISGASLFAARQKAKKILTSDGLVSDFSFQFKLPDKLNANIIIKKPYFAFKNKGADSFLLSDFEGQILGVTRNTSLPVVLGEGDTKVGQKLGARELFALRLMAGVFQMYQVRTGEMIDSTLKVELPSNVRVIFPLEGDIDVLLGSLRLIYAKIEPAEAPGKYREIDLRFKNPVLR